MRRLAILHFNPIEIYPPVLNWLNFLGTREEKEFRVKVFTIGRPQSNDSFVPASQNIRIFRPGRIRKKKASTYLNYLAYYLISTMRLIIWRPDTVLYYETLSCLPAFFYKKYINRKARLFIHYHEYTSAAEYDKAGLLTRWSHKKEKSLLSAVEWISQTNAQRVELFRQDFKDIELPPVQVLPNYPPASWATTGQGKDQIGRPVRLVYVGALSLDTMFVRELAEWVMAQSGKVTWDIYSDNISGMAKSYLASCGNERIRFRGSENYYSLPPILAKYDVGVILYKGHIPNYVYNAPNKLFEYMACGLDVWFPNVMKGSLPFVTNGVYPKVLSIDLQNMDHFDLSSAVDRSGLQYTSSMFYCERELNALLNKMNENKVADL